MPGGDGTGPRGQGAGTGRGQGRGQGGGRGRMGGTLPGSGPGGNCVCPQCGARLPHGVGGDALHGAALSEVRQRHDARVNRPDHGVIAPRLSAAAIRDNHARLRARRELFRRHGLDHARVRRFVLAQAGKLRAPLLEIGTGRGLTTLALARAGYTFTSVDRNRATLHIAALNLAHARVRSKVTLRHMDAYELACADASIATVIMVDALHHLHERDRLCRELDRVLKPGGRLVLADLNAHGQRVVDTIHRGEGRRHRLSKLTPPVMQRWLQRHGYRLTAAENDKHWLLLAKKPHR